MLNRLELHDQLCKILGSSNVYYQPPESIKLAYPAIVYSLKELRKKSANNGGYLITPVYEAILIDFNPDSEYIGKILSDLHSSFDRSYIADNLNHFVFTTYAK